MKQYELIRSYRKSLSVQISRDGRVIVRAPMHLPQNRIDAFLLKKESWIVAHLERQRQRASLAPSPLTPEELQALKEQARAYLPDRVAYWSRQTGLVPTGIKITSARSRYGSCSGTNSLCFSCFLMQLPPEAIDLVVVHELCHLREKNHGPAFYALLAKFLPDYRQRKALLR